MKNKKLISLICALSMIFTMFSAFTVVNADEGTKGIALTSNLSDDGKTITIDATATGGITAINNFAVNINIPENVTAEDITLDPATYGSNIMSDGTLNIAYNDTSATGLALTDGKLVKITIKLDNPLSKDYVAELQSKSAIKPAGETSLKMSNNTLPAASTTVSKWVDPNAKPPVVVTAKPTPAVVPPAPVVPEPVVPEGKGIKLDANLSKDGKTITIDATATGGITAINNFAVNINIPENVTAEDITLDPATYGSNIMSDGTLNIAYNDTSATGLALTDGKLVKITIKLDNPLTDVYVAELQSKSAIKPAGETSLKMSNNTLTAASAVITPTVEKPAVVNSAPLKDFVGKDKTTGKDGATVAAEAEAAGKDVYMTVDVKKDGAKAAYGSDYVALMNGKEIATEEEFFNLVTGNTAGTKVSDVIKSLTFNFLSNGKFTVDTTLQADGDTEQLVNSPETNEVSTGTQTPTPEPAKAAMTLTADKTQISSDGSTRVNAAVTDAEDATPGTEVKFEITSGDNYLDFDGVKETTVALDSDKKASVRVYAKAVGTATVKASYTYTDAEGAEQTIDKTVNIRVVNTVVGSDSTSSGRPQTGGDIAGPATSINNPTVLGGFTDLDSVEWAKPAITMLSLKGIVSGRGDGTFAPNDNITRGEYCQILIGAIGKNAEYADSEFADVPSDAWFYHAVSVASKYGIVSGYGDGNFGPYDLITRQDMALMTYKAAQVMNTDISAVRTMSFADAGAISDYAAVAVQTLADASIINGVSDTEFAPKANATRAQAAKILYDTFVKVN